MIVMGMVVMIVMGVVEDGGDRCYISLTYRVNCSSEVTISTTFTLSTSMVSIAHRTSDAYRSQLKI